MSNQKHEETEILASKAVSRREFLKIAAVAGAAIGVGAGLGGVLAACGAEETTTTTAATAGTTTTAGSTNTTAAASTTTVSAGAEVGREIKIGLVSAKTGALASFAVADTWWIAHAMAALPDGAVCGDGKQHKFSIIQRDSQSDSNRAAQVAADLATNDNVDMLMASGSPDTANPVADQAEALGVPCLCNWVPWQPFFFGRGGTPDKPFKWTFAHAIGVEDIFSNFIAMWDQIPTNKVVGMFFANDADGQAFTDPTTGFPPIAEAAGYTAIFPGLYTVGTEDFTKEISEFKKGGCDISCAVVTPPDYSNYWKQAVQQGFNPKLDTVGKALLFPQTAESVGPIAYNATVELAWHPTYPFADSITGMSCQELADDYEAKTGQQWTGPLTQYAKFEWAVDVYKRSDPEDKEAVAAAIGSTKLVTCLGPLDFTVPVDMTDPLNRHPVFNCIKSPSGGGQWVKGTKYAFDLVCVSNANSPDIPVGAKVQEVQYS
jgi:branched-chain amino acid transport system substrate-binding protein